MGIKSRIQDYFKTHPEDEKDFDSMCDISIGAVMVVEGGSLYISHAFAHKPNLFVGAVSDYLSSNGPMFIRDVASHIHDVYGIDSIPELYNRIPTMFLETVTLLALIWAPFLAYNFYRHKSKH